MTKEVKHEKKKVYVETTVVSDATALPTRDIVQLGRQVVTREWWATAAQRFDLFSSPERGLCLPLHLYTADASGRRP